MTCEKCQYFEIVFLPGEIHSEEICAHPAFPHEDKFLGSRLRNNTATSTDEDCPELEEINV